MRQRAVPKHDSVIQRTAPVERRVDAIQAVLEERDVKAAETLGELRHLAQEQWIPQNGARVVAKAPAPPSP